MVNTKKIISITMCLIMLFTLLPVVEVKAETTQSVFEITNDGTIIEKELYMDSDNISVILERITKPSGNTKLTLTKGAITQTYNSTIDYLGLKSFLDNSYNSSGVLRAVDVHGPNFKHTLFSINQKTISRAEAKVSASAVATILGSYLGLPLSACGVLGRSIYEMVTNNGTIYSVKVSEEIYEVFFKSDNVYYTHCYHEKVTSYDSGGHYISETTSMYERVGG